MLRPDPAREPISQIRPDPHGSRSSKTFLRSVLWNSTGRDGKTNINKIIRGICMDCCRITSFVRLAIVLLGMSVLLPACVSTGSSTSGHVDAKLREHGI
ncbi:hypothetical protein [Methylobacterium sp. sgz302541]|uniref:hypothetical protein n=1 Tax=Methylobacterium sp. sgz302541 TaxID=3418177 RepID=UPI003D354FE0